MILYINLLLYIFDVSAGIPDEGQIDCKSVNNKYLQICDLYQIYVKRKGQIDQNIINKYLSNERESVRELRPVLVSTCEEHVSGGKKLISFPWGLENPIIWTYSNK